MIFEKSRSETKHHAQTWDQRDVSLWLRRALRRGTRPGPTLNAKRCLVAKCHLALIPPASNSLDAGLLKTQRCISTCRENGVRSCSLTLNGENIVASKHTTGRGFAESRSVHVFVRVSTSKDTTAARANTQNFLQNDSLESYSYQRNFCKKLCVPFEDTFTLFDARIF